jgi:hypothetical protein
MTSIQIRINAINEFLSKKITAEEASRRLDLHRVSFWRLVKKFERHGAKGVEHGLKGKRSNHAKPEAFKRAVRALYEKDYAPSGLSVHAFYQEVKDGLLRSVSYAAVLSWIFPFRENKTRNLVHGNVREISADTNSGAEIF